jgi:hypothetical protein
VVRCKASEAIDLNQGPDAVIGSELIAAFRVNAVLVKVKLGHRIPCWWPFFAREQPPRRARYRRRCRRISHSLSGIAGSRGVRFFSKREQELSPWCGSNT